MDPVIIAAVLETHESHGVASRRLFSLCQERKVNPIYGSIKISHVQFIITQGQKFPFPSGFAWGGV